MRHTRPGTRPGALAVNSGATQARRFSGKRICDAFRYACWDSVTMTVLTTYTEWSEGLWTGLPRPVRVGPCPPAPPERPFIPGAIAAGQPIRSFADLDRASDDETYRRHRDRRPSSVAQVTGQLPSEQISTLSRDLERERRLRIEAERALAVLRATPPLATRPAPPPLSASAVRLVPCPPGDPATSIPTQVPTQGRGLPAAAYCEVCGDTRFWTDADKRVWRCAGCHPPSPGQLVHRTGRWH
jgi:hypothetical protein